MAWEDRPGGRVYCHSRRVGPTVRKVYYGRGILAALMSDQVEAGKARKRSRACALGALKTLLDGLDRESALVESYVGVLFEAAMVLAGYHRHDRGAWRLKHGRGK